MIEDKILLIFNVIGPAFNRRVVYHLNKYESFNLFDLVILTDSPEFYKDVKLKGKLNIYDINKLHEQLPKFKKYEVLPDKVETDQEFTQVIFGLRQKRHRFPLHVERLVYLCPEVYEYTYFARIDADMVPDFTSSSYNQLLEHLKNKVADNSVCTYKVVDTYTPTKKPDKFEPAKKYLQAFARDNNKELPQSMYDSFTYIDNPLKLFKITSKEVKKAFFDNWNSILLDLYKRDDEHSRHFLSGSWNICVGPVLMFVYRLTGIVLDNTPTTSHHTRSFKSYTFPEDRFYEDSTHRGFNCNVDSQKEFIELNYEKLKEFYKEYNQEFEY